LIHQHATLIVIVLIMFSGEAGLFAGAAFVAAGRMSLLELIVLGTVVSFLGNMMYYCLGMFVWNNGKVLNRKFGVKVERSKALLNKYGTPVMIISRFLYGVRNIIPICLGLYRVNVMNFAIYNLIGSFLWTIIFTSLGASFQFLLSGRIVEAYFLQLT